MRGLIKEWLKRKGVYKREGLLKSRAHKRVYSMFVCQDEVTVK